MAHKKIFSNWKTDSSKTNFYKDESTKDGLHPIFTFLQERLL